MSIGERKGEARTESRVRGGFFSPGTPGNASRTWRLSGVSAGFCGFGASGRRHLGVARYLVIDL